MLRCMTVTIHWSTCIVDLTGVDGAFEACGNIPIINKHMVTHKQSNGRDMMHKIQTKPWKDSVALPLSTVDLFEINKGLC